MGYTETNERESVACTRTVDNLSEDTWKELASDWGVMPTVHHQKNGRPLRQVAEIADRREISYWESTD